MATEDMSVDKTGDTIKPNPLPRNTYEEVKARAQSILDARGLPPYQPRWDSNPLSGENLLNEEEALVLSEFVWFWLPFLKQPKVK